MDQRSSIKYHGSWIKDHGSRIMDQVSSIKYPVSRIKDLGPCSGMNDHPGRDTDLRSRPSESTIKDLSFYIGFIKIQSSNKHVGPCFGTNGHFRRDPDTISRLSDTTNHFLSVFIGFRCSNRVKLVILDENTGFIRLFIEKLKKSKFYSVPGIILDHIQNQFFDIENSKFYKILHECF